MNEEPTLTDPDRTSDAPERSYVASETLNAQALERILNETGAGLTPVELDRSKLWNDIVQSIELRSMVSSLSSSSRTAEEIKRLKQIKTLAIQLQRVLSDEHTWATLQRSWQHQGRTDHPLDMLAPLVKAVNEIPLYRSTGAAESKFFKGFFGPGSSFEQLVDKHLPKVFSDHFHLKATVSRRADGTPDSPYVRFAMQVLKEFNIQNRGKPYTPESIVTARSGKRTRPRAPLGKAK
jgi:hypothetical protein